VKVKEGQAPADDPDVLLTIAGDGQQLAAQRNFELWLYVADARDSAEKPDESPDARRRRRLDEQFDAFWWTMSGVEKFMLSYYIRLFDPAEVAEAAATFRNEFRQGAIVGVGHLPWSEWDTITIDDVFLAAVPAITLEGGLLFLKASELRAQRFR